MALLIPILGVVVVRNTPSGISPKIDIPVVSIIWMYAQVRFTLNQAEPAILLPSNTLIVRADGPQVAAVENNVVHMRKVVLGRDFGQQIEVISGVAEKELIVTNPPDFVREGAQVTIAAPPGEKSRAAPNAAPPATVKDTAKKQ